MASILKSAKALLLMIALGITLAACAAENETEYPDFSVTVNDELGCAELSYNGVVYRPFGVFTNRNYMGAQIGIREDSPDNKIHEITGYPQNEWIAEHQDVLMGGIMIFKAVGVDDIPSELEQYRQYDY